MREEGHPQTRDKKTLSEKANDKACMSFSFSFAHLQGLKEGKVFSIVGTFSKLVSLMKDASKYKVILFHFD